MSSRKETALVIADLRGGRNDADPPEMLPEDQCVEALNVDWWDGTCANKRGGATAIGMTFSSGGPFAGSVGSLIRHVPGNDETAAELFGFDTGGTTVVGRLAAATTWAAVTLKDNLSAAADGLSAVGVSLNGFLFLGYKTGQNRLQVWDASLSKIRRVGLATPAAPTTTPDGAGGLSLTRYHRVRWVDVSGTDVRRRSEASGSVSTTIAAKAGITVNRPTLASEDETHWEVEGADASTGPWYRIARVAAATTTYDDTGASISTTNLSVSTGLNLPPPSARYLLTDDNRLVMAGCFETSGGYITPKNNRVWWSPVIGTSSDDDTDDDIGGDAERIVTNTAFGAGYLDVEAAITGLAGPLHGSIYVFGYRRIWKMVPTGLLTAPYQRFTVSTGIGCIDHRTIVQAEDENGTPCIYFLSQRGPYRLGANGLQYLGGDNETLWATVNFGATNRVAFGVYHVDKHQIWWWIATGSSNTPDTRIVFDTKLGRTVAGDAVSKGWAKHTGDSCAAYCAVLFSKTIGATMSRDLKPHIGQTGAANRVWQCDSGATSDNGTSFQAYVDTREYGTVGMNHAVREGVLIANVASGSTVNVTVKSDFGLASAATAAALLTAAGSETRVQKRLDGMQTSGVGTFSLRIGDSGASTNVWTVDAVRANVTEQEARS